MYFDILSFHLHFYREWSACYSVYACVYKYIHLYVYVHVVTVGFFELLTSLSAHALYKYSLAVRLNIPITKINQNEFLRFYTIFYN